MRRLIFESEHDEFRASVRRFFQNEIAPHAEKWREQGFVDRWAFTKAGEQGYLLMWADEKYGAAGVADFRFEQIVYEENMRLRRAGLLSAAAFGSGRALHRQTRQRGAKGAMAAGLRSRRKDSGDRHDGARIRQRSRGYEEHRTGLRRSLAAQWLEDLHLERSARRSRDRRGALGARTSAMESDLFVVEADMPGFKRGGRLHKMGLDAQDTSELFFDAVKVPKANVLGDAAKGFGYLSQFLCGERLISSIDAVALAQTAFDLTLEFVQQRKAFGRPIGTFQHNRFVMAEMRAQIDAIQTFVDQCVLEYNAGRLTADLAAESKLLATELAGRVVDSCVQLHGGAGYMEEYRISRLYRDARVMRIFAGYIGNHERDHRAQPRPR